MGRRKLYVDLGAEQLLAADKESRKTFGGASEVKDLELALGQFVLYEQALRLDEPDRSLYLAVPEAVWELVFVGDVGQILVDPHVLRVVTFNVAKEEIVRWIPQLTLWCQALERILVEHASQPYAYGEIQTEVVVDRERGRYLLVDVGWNGLRRICGPLVHVDVIDGKFWIQYDRTEEGVATPRGG